MDDCHVEEPRKFLMRMPIIYCCSLDSPLRVDDEDHLYVAPATNMVHIRAKYPSRTNNGSTDSYNL